MALPTKNGRIPARTLTYVIFLGKPLKQFRIPNPIITPRFPLIQSSTGCRPNQSMCRIMHNSVDFIPSIFQVIPLDRGWIKPV